MRKKLNICERSDSYVPMSETISPSAASPEDLDVFGQAGTETENIESARLSKLSREVDVNDFGKKLGVSRIVNNFQTVMSGSMGLSLRIEC